MTNKEIESQSHLSELIIRFLRDYQESSLEQIIDFVWRDEEVEKNHDFPQDAVLKILEKLDSEGKINWDKEGNKVYLKEPSILDNFDALSKTEHIGPWEAILTGSYNTLSGENIDMKRIWKILKEQEIGIGKLKKDYFGEKKAFTITWYFGVCLCYGVWTKDRFKITSFMFEEPAREFIYYSRALPKPRPDFVLKAIPFAGIYLIYEFMKSIITSEYPTTTFQITTIRERMTRKA